MLCVSRTRKSPYYVDMATKKSSSKVGTRTPSANDTDGGKVEAKAKQSVAEKRAAELLAGGQIDEKIATLITSLSDSRTTTAVEAARVTEVIAETSPAHLSSHVEELCALLLNERKRVVQASARALPRITKVAPAKVAKHLQTLDTSFDDGIDAAKDGIIRTITALCIASVAYQKRVEPLIHRALNGADGKVLLEWSKILLPALKGEPHANAREVVESMLNRIPREQAQKIAEVLNIRLRLRYR